MKYRINLYSAELKPKLDLFNLSFVAGLWALLLLVLVAVFSQQYQQTQASQQQLQQQNNTLAQLQAELGVKMEALKALKPDPQLQHQVSELEETVQAKKVLISKLGVLAQINSGDYAGLMQDLARYRQSQLWLQQIQVQDRNIFIQGGALSSQALPQWLDKLKQSKYFRGQQFEQARLYRDQDDTLLFEIGSVMTNGTDSNAGGGQ